MHKHILICGEVGAGKSTAISKILASTNKHVYGYCTKSLNHRADGYHEIFIYPPSEPEKAVKIAECDTVHHYADTSVFETLGVELLRSVKPDGIILMDEIGFMEKDAERFKALILELLSGEIPIIGAVKARHPENEFLNRVKNHPNVDLYNLTEDNRNELAELLIKEGRFK